MWDNIKLLNKLGSGGMGEVWLAYHKVFGATFAVKQLQPSLVREKDLQRFEREIEILKAAPHDHVVKIVDYSTDPKRPGYAMECCPNGDLDSKLSETVGNTKVSLAYFWQIVDAVDHIHSFKRPIFHRDIKPSNVLIGADNKLKLSDFGLSRFADETTRVTSSNWHSLGFTAPEQMTDFSTADHRSDLYSLGCTLFYMLTGEWFHSLGQLRKISDPSINYILDALLQHNPDDRFRSAKDLKRAWEELHRTLEISKYLALSKKERLARIQKVLDVADDENVLDNSIAVDSFLEKVIKVETDQEVLSSAVKAHETAGKFIAQLIASME